MPQFNYASPNSVLDSVTVISTLNGSRRAYLHAPENLSPAQFGCITEILQTEGMLAYPAEYNGKHMLELRNIPSPERLLSTLRLHQFIDGKPEVVQLKEEQFSTKEKIANRTLNTAGKLYVTGDIALAFYAIADAMRGQYAELGAALGYAGGTQMILQYGKDQTPTKLMDISREMLKHLHTSGINTSGDSSLNHVAQDNDHTLTQKIDRFLRRVPSEAMSLCFSLAGVSMMIAAQDYHANQQSTKILDTVLGGVTLTSGLVGGFVQEKHHDPKEPHKHGLARVWEWVEEKPLRLAGYGLMVSTVIHGASTYNFLHEYYQDYKRTGDPEDLKKTVEKAFRGVFVVTNLLAEILISISSKGHGGGAKNDGGMHESAYAIAADAINRQPKAYQELAEENAAVFLSHRDALDESKETVLAGIRKQREMLKENPWAMHSHIHPRVESATTKAQDETPNGLWTARTPASSKLHLNHAETLQANRTALADQTTPRLP